MPVGFTIGKVSMKQFIATVVLAVGLLGSSAVLAVDCDSHIEQTERNLAHVLELMKDVKEEAKTRIQHFIDDAQKLLRQARKNCDEAASPLDKSMAASKALVAQGNLAAAQLLIKAN